MTELVPFASDEWITKLHAVAREHTELLDSIRTLEGPITLVVRPEPQFLPDGLVIWIDGGFGEIREIAKLQREDDQPTKFVLTADYGVWERISQGKQGIIKAVLFGKIRVKGDKVLLLRQVRTATALAQLLSDMPTRYVER
jgi:hypothetical protein